MDRGWLARRLEAGASYEELAREAGCSASKVAYWASKYGLRSTHTDRHAGRGGVDEQLLRQLVGAHYSIREIAETLDRSAATIRHHLGRLGLETSPSRRSPAAMRAAARGDAEATLYCDLHGITRHVRRDSGYRCATCRVDDVTARRRRVKRLLLEEAGSVCVLCGYDRCVAALHFHHLDPEHKSFGVSAAGVTRSLEAARAEASKCVVLCANCHAEVESGLADLPSKIESPGTRAG